VVVRGMPGEHSVTERGLDEIAAYERTRRDTPLTAAMRSLGKWKYFASVYRRVGPTFDPWLMRVTHGRAISRIYGMPALILDTVGARSGLPRSSALLYLRDSDAFAVVGTNFGQLHHPAWTGNLLARPEAEVEVGAVRLPVRAELADQEAWDRLWPKFCAIYPGYADYLERCGDRTPRLFLLHPVEEDPVDGRH